MVKQKLLVGIAAIAILAAGILPACVNGVCCAKAEKASIHAEMPCCKGERSMAPAVAKPAPAAMVAVIAQVQTTVVIATTNVVPAPIAFATDSDIHREPPPSPYLLHAQFRI